MRMRKKKNLAPRMEACGMYLIKDPFAMRGRWRELMPGAAELRVPTTWYVLAEKYKIPLAEALSKIKMANPQVGRFSWQELYGVERQNPMRKPNKERRENPLLSEENLARFRKMFE